MPETTPALPDPYRVQPGDTLGAIARRSGRSVADLQRFNAIENPNRIEVGQTLYLSRESAYSVSVLFLDALRNPIENLSYQLHLDGKILQGVTDATGAVLDKVTDSAQSRVEVWIRNSRQQWQQVTSTLSGYGHKLITAVSGFIVIKGETERLPDGATPKPMATEKPSSSGKSGQAPLPKKAGGTPTKNNDDVKTKKKKGPKGQPLVAVNVDLPEGLLTLFQNYKAEKITDEHWKDAADYLKCEEAVLRAIARVESSGVAFWKFQDKTHSGIMPAIMYERQYFHRLTCANGPLMNTKKHTYHGKGVKGCLSPHDTIPDICYPHGFVGRYGKGNQKTLGTANANMPDGKVEVSDQYGSYATSYLRLINAYRRNAEAALKSCSWGMFQIMGDEHRASCGVRDFKAWIESMCTSEVAQLEQFRNFIENKANGKLHQAVKDKDWQNIARYYNGPGYKQHNYDTRIQAAYEAIRAKS
jgi:LysM repeat protein